MEKLEKINLESNVYRSSFLILLLFAFFRPLTFIYLETRIFNLNILELFTLIFSYLLIFPILLNVRKIKLDKINYIILLFCGYVGLSAFWGSQIREVARMLLPFVLFFCVRTIVDTENKMKTLLVFLIIGFTYPIVGSFFSIIMKAAGGELLWHTGVFKTQGLFIKPHPFAHAMLLFIFIFSFFTYEMETKKVLVKAALISLFALSIFCIYESHVRTVYLGLIVFCIIYLWVKKQTLFWAFILIMFCLITFNLTISERIFWQTDVKREQSLESASSGRLSGWKHNLNVYQNYNIHQMIGGVGLGNEGKKVKNTNLRVLPAHNDFLGLLMTLGPIGLLLYIAIYLILLKDFLYSKLRKSTKFWFVAMMFSIITMNFVSNSYIFRVELSQIFWLFIALFYNLENIRNQKYDSVNV